MLSPVPVEQFRGLNLADDPGEVGWNGAIDCLNIDFDRRGRMRSRDGFAKFTTAAALGAYHSLAPFYTSGGTKQLIGAFGGASGAVNALNTSGGIVAAQSAANSTYASVARFAAPGSEHAYVAVSGSGAATVYRWDGTAWSTPAWTTTTPTGRHLAVTAEGRLANARYNGTVAGNSPSTVRFCDISGTPPTVVPTTWPANNYVEVSPGDGEEIMALVTWGANTFAFKQTKFGVIYGTATDSSGNPIFQLHMETSQGLAGGVGGAAYRAIAVAPHGVYFANRRGIWLTTGSSAQLVSRAVDPLFRGDVSTPGPSAINQAAIDQCAMVWHDQRLWFAYPSGSATTNDRVLRFDPATDTWSLYDFPASALASFRIGNSEELVFAFAGSTLTIGVPQSPTAAVSSTTGTLTNNQAYFYKVTALNAAGETTPSSEVTATARTAPGTPGTPSLALQAGGSLPVGTAAYYLIVAMNNEANSAQSVEVSIVPTSANRTVALSWAASSGTPSSYRIYRVISPFASQAYRDVGNVTSYTDDGSGTFTTGTAPAGAVDYRSVALAWTAVSGATSYRVYRGTTTGGENVFYAPGNVVAYTDTNAASTGGSPPVSNTATVAGFDVARHSSAYTVDGGDGTTTGAGITSRYRSGFNTLPPSLRADGKRVIRQWHLKGSGTVTFGVAADDAVAIPTTAGGAQSSVSLTAARPNYRTSQIGNNASWQVNAATAWRLDSLQADLA